MDFFFFTSLLIRKNKKRTKPQNLAFQHSKVVKIKQNNKENKTLLFYLLRDCVVIFSCDFFCSCCMDGFIKHPEGNSLCTSVISA